MCFADSAPASQNYGPDVAAQRNPVGVSNAPANIAQFIAMLNGPHDFQVPAQARSAGGGYTAPIAARRFVSGGQ